MENEIIKLDDMQKRVKEIRDILRAEKAKELKAHSIEIPFVGISLMLIIKKCR